LALDAQAIDIAGHSLGGGTGSAAAVASGKDAWTFNAAGLHQETVARYGGTPQPSNIHAFHVKGDFLTVLQLITPLPDAAGTAHSLPGSGSPLARHAIQQVIDGIEKQKVEDMSIRQPIAT
jgi:hypothetical protein